MESYEHKKFSQGFNKRKFHEINAEGSASTVITFDTPETIEHPPKRRQTQTFFRPWLSGENNVVGNDDVDARKRKPKKQAHRQTGLVHPLIVQYHPNKVRSFPPKERTLKEQQRRDRNTLSCLLSRRARKIEQAQIEQEYGYFRQQQKSVVEESLRLNIYLQELQMRLAAFSGSWIPNYSIFNPALPTMDPSQQVFVFGQQ